MTIKGYSTTNHKRHPIHEKNGVGEKDFRVGDEIYPSRIPVGQQNSKRWGLQKLIALDATPRKFTHEIDAEVKGRMK